MHYYDPWRPRGFDQTVDDIRQGLSGPVDSDLKGALDKVAAARLASEFEGMQAPLPHLTYAEERALEEAGLGTVEGRGIDGDSSFVPNQDPKPTHARDRD